MTHRSDDPKPPCDTPCSSPPCYAAEFPGYFVQLAAYLVLHALAPDAEPATAQVLGDLLDPDADVGRNALDGRDEGLAVGFPGRQVAQHGA